MRNRFLQLLLGLLINGISFIAFAGDQGPVSMMQSGFYGGVGGSWNTVDETFNSLLLTSAANSAEDHYDISDNRFAPMVQLGYWAPWRTEWLWGIAAQWKHLYYNSFNEDSNLGQHLQNASFASINIFGPNVIRDFSSQTRINNEVMALFYLGEQFKHSYVSLGLGPVLFTTRSNVYVSSVHHPIGGGDNLLSTGVQSNNILWGGAAQAAYNYYINPTWFLTVSYTYAQSAKRTFNNQESTLLLNGGAGVPALLDVNRTVRIIAQDVMFSINKVF